MKTTEVKQKPKQLSEVKQLMDFSLRPVEGGFFDVEVDSPNTHVVVRTKVQSKYMMKHKGKEHVEEASSPTKMTRK
jgi:hypothetical protein